MIGMRLGTAKQFFFDRKAVMDPVKKAEKANLGKAGAFIRATARKMLKPSPDISLPGQPPHLHVSQTKTVTIKRGKRAGQQKQSRRYLYKDSILFIYDEVNHSVIVGPILFGGSNSKDMPSMLEKGGMTTRVRFGKRVTVHYRARPHIRPALAEEIKKLPGQWAGSVRG